MARKQNDTGRALEYAIAEEFYKNNFTFGPLALQHRVKYKPYFDGLHSTMQNSFLTAAKSVLAWFRVNFKGVTPFLDALPDLSGSVVDIYIGDQKNAINLSIKHNHLDMRHNRPHGLPARCGLTPSEADAYLSDVYKIEKQMRIEDPSSLFRNMKNKAKWMRLLNENALNYLSIWQRSKSSSVQTYFNFLTGNDRPYYKILVSDSSSKKGVWVHEFLTNTSPNSLSLYFNNLDYLVLEYDNGWAMTKRIHNASSRVGKLDMNKFDQSQDWKWAVALQSHPSPKIYKI
jgi:hypothetical protein